MFPRSLAQNNFAVKDAAFMFHLRTLLINCIVDFACTFAQLAARPGTVEKWRAHIFEEERGSVPRQAWISEASEAVELLRSAEFADQPVRFICEAQMLLNNVYQVRKCMHEVSVPVRWSSLELVPVHLA